MRAYELMIIFEADLEEADLNAQLKQVTDLVEAAGGEIKTTDKWGKRRFADEVGIGLGEWRTRARMVRAVRLLAEGDTATSVALAVGYATPSAFGSAFRRTLGTTPWRWFAEGR